MKTAGGDQRQAGRDNVAILGLTNLKSAKFIEALSECEREMRRDVLDDANAGQAARQPGQDHAQCFCATGGCAH